MRAQNLLRGVKNEFYDLAHSLNSWRFWKTVAATAVGLTLFSVGINGLIIPHKFIASGATGLALIVYYVARWPSVGMIYWLINIPILLMGWRVMSLKYVVLALMGVFLSGATMQLTYGIHLPVSDPLMASIISGILTGTGVGFYLRFGGSAGGIDIVAAVFRRKFGVPMSTTFISVNAFNFLIGGLVHHDLNVAFYTAIAMYVHSRLVEKVQTGFSERKAAWIITSQPDEIAQQIMRRLNRGVTFLQGTGGMSQKTTRVIFTVINMVELARLKEIIFGCDPQAFLTVNNTSEVIGNRFVTWEQEGFAVQKAARKSLRTSVRSPSQAPLFAAPLPPTATGALKTTDGDLSPPTPHPASSPELGHVKLGQAEG